MWVRENKNILIWYLEVLSVVIFNWKKKKKEKSPLLPKFYYERSKKIYFEVLTYVYRAVLFFFIFSNPNLIEKVLLLCQIFEIEILMKLQVFEISWIQKSHFYSWSVCVSVHYQHNSKTYYTKNTKFGIQHLYHMLMLLKTFYEDWTNSLYVQKHT